MDAIISAIARFFDNLKISSPVGYLIIVGLLVGAQEALGRIEAPGDIVRYISVLLTFIAGIVGTRTTSQLSKSETETVDVAKTVVK